MGPIGQEVNRWLFRAIEYVNFFSGTGIEPVEEDGIDRDESEDFEMAGLWGLSNKECE
jgi:hypothetical protein